MCKDIKQQMYQRYLLAAGRSSWQGGGLDWASRGRCRLIGDSNSCVTIRNLKTGVRHFSNTQFYSVFKSMFMPPP